MSKKITWPSLVFPAINLWNCPRQDELNKIKMLKALVYVDKVDIKLRQGNIKHIEAAIKEREFLYYLRSGRFPE
jgi:hypothetical protein